MIMKKIVTILGVLGIIGFVIAQEDETTDTTRFSLGNKNITITAFGDKEEIEEEDKPSDFNYWLGSDLGVNGFITDGNFGINNDPENVYMELNYSKSLNLNINVFEYSTELGTDKVLFVTGLGFRFNRYAFKNTNTTLSFNETTVYPQLDTVNEFHKNFLNTSYVSIPLMVAVVPGKVPKKSFHLSLGVIGSFRLGSRVKQRYDFNNQNLKDIKRGHYHINPFLLDATARIGIGRFTVYANYGLTSLFERNKGPEYYPFAIGLASRL